MVQPDPSSQDELTSKDHITLWPVWNFAVHVIVGTLIFAVIASGAVALNIINARLEPLGIDRVIRYGLKAAEYAVFITDLSLFLVFLAKTGARAVRSF